MPVNTDKKTHSDELIPVDYMLINYELRMFGAVLVLLKKEETEFLPTAGVGVRDGVGRLLYNRSFMELASFNKKIFIMMHEVSHLILSSLSRGVSKERILWNVATDIMINEMIQKNFKMSIPENALSFEFLEKNKLGSVKEKDRNIYRETAEKLYEEIKTSIVKTEAVDNHVIFHTKEGGKIYGELVGKVYDSEKTEGRLGKKVKEILKETEQGGYGNLSGDFVKSLKRAAGVNFPFEQILEKIFEKRKYDFSRKNRRLKTGKSFFPRRKNAAYKVYAAVDVSGSVYDFTEQFLGYIVSLPEFEEVVFFDTGIVHTLKKGDNLPERIAGYGGTDLTPVLDRWADIEKKSFGTKLNFVCLTDGYVAPFKNRLKIEVIVFTCGIDVPGCRNIKVQR